jgi:hypothetical protein
MTNHGIIPGKTPTDWLTGTIPWENRNPSANWRSSLVVGEKQYFSNFDTMACVSFATNNTCEIQIKAQTGIEVNESDRFLAKISGTTEQGNRVSTVLDARRKNGVVDEFIWPKPGEPTTWAAYYSEIPFPVKDLAKKALVRYDLVYEYLVDNTSNYGYTADFLRYHLQHAPLLITIPGHEITGFAVDDNNNELWVLDDYIYNVDPSQPFIRKIKLTDITDVFKAVLTVKNKKGLPMVIVTNTSDVNTKWLLDGSVLRGYADLQAYQKDTTGREVTELTLPDAEFNKLQKSQAVIKS